MRCAIYTRKSSREGLEQPLNSLDSQHLACSHFIASQASEGWAELGTRYDDGGHSGGTLARPALQRLMRDVESGRVDIVVVYKIDRLSRSLRDFVRLVETFERHSVTFASVTQQFSTTSSMGRLTLNVLLAFAQFERELTSERTRDKFAALRSKGMRPQGGRPFGYRFSGRHLEIDEAEAALIRRIFASFIRLRTATSIPERLNRAGLLNHRGRPFTLAFVRRLLRNRLYRGDLVHQGQATPGAHPAIISQRVWDRAQLVMTPHAERWGNRRYWGRPMLTGLLFGPYGPLLHEAGLSKGKAYRYYGPPKRLRKGVPKCDNGRFRAVELEQAVLAQIDPGGRLMREASSTHEAGDLVRSLVRRIDLGAEMVIQLKTGLTISIPLAPWLNTGRLPGRSIVASCTTAAPGSSNGPTPAPSRTGNVCRVEGEWLS